MTSSELDKYQVLLQDLSDDSTNDVGKLTNEDLKMSPLIWWAVKTCGEGDTQTQRGYAVLGHNSAEYENFGFRTPVLLNTDSPWSAFICGSQGSGKSHTLSCMLENCLLTKESLVSQIGKNPNPLAGLVFHYDRCQGSGVCEAAYLCTQIPTTVLVSPSNYERLKNEYESMAKGHGASITVKRLYILDEYLDTERMKILMAVSKEQEMPLYMQSIMAILREMAMETQGSAVFDYKTFKAKLDAKTLTPAQLGPLTLRLELLESFMRPKTRSKKKGKGADQGLEQNHLEGKEGTLTIVDLTDPVIEADAACALFDICLSVFIQQTRCGKVVALDEAHHYMIEDSGAAQAFTEKLLRTVREQRHQAVRVIIATQEPSINTQLLDLCSITMVHRCTSPAWFKILKQHVAALYLHSEPSPGGDTNNHWGGADIRDEKALFQQIVELKLGESLLFCPTAAVGVTDEGIAKMHGAYVKFKTRQRVTADGGRSKLAAGGSHSDG